MKLKPKIHQVYYALVQGINGRGDWLIAFFCGIELRIFLSAASLLLISNKHHVIKKNPFTYIFCTIGSKEKLLLPLRGDNN